MNTTKIIITTNQVIRRVEVKFEDRKKGNPCIREFNWPLPNQELHC